MEEHGRLKRPGDRSHIKATGTTNLGSATWHGIAPWKSSEAGIDAGKRLTV